MNKKNYSKKPLIILGIETSCDETAAATIRGEGNRVQLLSNIISSSAQLQSKYGGVLPEQAAREQVKYIIPVIQEALRQSGLASPDIDAIAVTQGPGLIGSLLVGVETAKTLSLVWKRPLIPVNHLIAHFYGNWISKNQESRIKDQSKNKLDSNSLILTPSFPAICLLVSGGHTDLILMKNHGKYDYLGGTRDDAAGECFDKCARLLGLPYPGGPSLARLAEKGDPRAYKLPRPMINSGDYDFSFSGLKTAVANIVTAGDAQEQQKSNLAASTEQAIVDVLIKKTITAAKNFNVDQIMLAGGVAANRRLAKQVNLIIQREIPKAQLFIPPSTLCTDNAVTIATAAYYNFFPVNPLAVQANPNLSLA